ncbi:MAG: hypothetical protein M3345_03825 [Actinomycetota bacterium]|nr:hypothetical protein [Actinomycetota bacterium]
MKLGRMAAVGAMSAIVAGALVAPAAAETTVIDASLATALSMTTAPAANVSGWNLAATGANSTSGGSLAVNANVPYTVTMSAQKTTLTEYVTATSAYEATAPKSLGSPLTVTPTSTGGTGVAAAATSATGGVVVTGIGGGTDSFTLSLSQPTTIADDPLTTGRTYHNVLTYTLASTL